MNGPKEPFLVMAQAIPALDNRPCIRQARGVEPPPLLKPQAGAPKPKSKRRRKIIFFIAIPVVLAAVLMVTALHRGEPLVNVQTEKVARHTITETVVANGKIYPVVQVHISPEVSGEIIELNVKEGQFVHKGDVLLKIKPEYYLAALNQAKASYQSSLASKATAAANLEKADAEFKRNKELYGRDLISESDFISFKVARDVAMAGLESAGHQVDVAHATVDSAQDSLDKTTIVAPLDGTVTKLNSQLGERVLGTIQNAGTDIMIISDLSQMEARVDIGEMDIVLVKPGQKATLEVDSFKDKKFVGLVTDVANSSEGLNASSALGGYGGGGGGGGSSTGQSATQFQVRIRFSDRDEFRPGMSVAATIETRTHTNAVAVPIASVTTRVVKSKTESAAVSTNKTPATNAAIAATQTAQTNSMKTDKKFDAQKPVDVVFVIDGHHVKTVPVKIGISDDNFWEITEGLKEGDEIVTGNYQAISRDLDDGKKIVKSGGASVAKSKS